MSVIERCLASLEVSMAKKLVIERSGFGGKWQVRNDWNDNVLRPRFNDLEEAIEYARDYAHHQGFEGVVVPPGRTGYGEFGGFK